MEEITKGKQMKKKELQLNYSPSLFLITHSESIWQEKSRGQVSKLKQMLEKQEILTFCHKTEEKVFAEDICVPVTRQRRTLPSGFATDTDWRNPYQQLLLLHVPTFT